MNQPSWIAANTASASQPRTMNSSMARLYHIGDDIGP